MTFKEIQQTAQKQWDDFSGLKKPRILIGAATCGRAAGALEVRAAFEEELSAGSLEADIHEVGCLGMCYAEPMIEIGLPDGRRMLYGDVTAEMVPDLVRDVIAGSDPRTDLALASFGETAVEGLSPFGELPMMTGQVRVVLRNAGIIDPSDVHHYIARGGYSGLAAALDQKPEEVVDEVVASGLRGRGGAGFPTGLKWGFARKAESDTKYVICNADEGDPGAFMDRSVLESDPHAVLEGLAIAAYAIGAEHGYIYVRAEYPLAIERLTTAIAQMEELGLAGKNIMGSDFNFSMKIKKGAGAFVCGEETSLMASIEGRRGMPRPRPPFPANSGLYGKPTNINNVETLANVSEILSKGGKWFSEYGTEKSKGTKTFALAGKINRTGLIEVPMGISLHDIVYTIGGGIPNNKKFKAVQTGGPSGGCLPGSLIDLGVDYEKLAEAGSIMGSGGMIIMDEDSCMVDITRYFLEFTHNESCGKCVPCRMGSQHLLRILTDITEGKGTPDHLAQLDRLCGTIKSGSLCALGQTLPNPVLSMLRYFREEFEEHILRKECRAMVCMGLISSRCQYTCPISQDVPAYIGHIAREDFAKAIETVRIANPLPGICGRVCPHECETQCEAAKYGDPIAIRSLKRFAADYERDNDMRAVKAEVKYEERVAIVGAGPAGLAAGYYLAGQGYQCTIFEALDKAGGMLITGIPEYRLPRDILEWEIRYIEETGVEIKTGTALGKDFTVDELFDQGYKAVFLALGAHQPFELRMEGEENDAVLPGVGFLKSMNLGGQARLGETVAVIGGGNVAIDSARSAVRLGSKQVFIVYRRSREEMPALAEELEQLEEENIEIKFLAAPAKAVIEDGTFKGIECITMELGEPDKSGRRRPVPVEGSEFMIECDNVISAIGQTSDLDGLQGANIPATDWGTIKADEETLLTSREGVFAGGDVVSGPANVVDAIAHGKRAAVSIDQYLRGQEIHKDYMPTRPAVDVDPVELSDEEIAQLGRPAMPCVKGSERVCGFMEVEQGFDNSMAVIEAKRCLRCDRE